MSFIITERKGKVGTIIMNRPTKRNALSNAFAIELTRAIVDFNHDEDIVVILLKSSEPVFCAGADLSYMQELQEYTYHENIKDSFDLMKLYKALYLSPKITIAQVEGHAIAGGAGLATITDFTFAVPEAKFGYTEVKIGFIPAIVSNFLTKKIGTAQLKKLLFTGDLISAKKAKKLGMITSVIKENIQEYTIQFISELLSNCSHQSLLATKEVLIESENMTLDDALSFSATMNAKARDTSDCKKGLAAFLKKETVKWS